MMDVVVFVFFEVRRVFRPCTTARVTNVTGCLTWFFELRG